MKNKLKAMCVFLDKEMEKREPERDKCVYPSICTYIHIYYAYVTHTFTHTHTETKNE